MKKALAVHGVLLAVLIVLVAAIVYVILDFERRTGAGKLIYCLDDGYIHMAMARNLVEHRVFGVTPYAFSSSSSSPLWTVSLAAAFTVLGVRELFPLILNMALSGAVLVFAASVLRAQHASRVLQVLILIVLLFHTPLIPNIFSGMEHVFHILASMMFLCTAATVLTEKGSRRHDRWLLILAPLLVGVRYEGLFLLGVVASLMLMRRLWRHAVLLVVVGATPVVALGLVSMANGAYFLPNSVLLKGSRPPLDSFDALSDFVRFGWQHLFESRWISRLTVVCVVLFAIRARRLGFWNFGQLLLVGCAATAYLHAQFAAWGWHYRYEAYLVAMGFLAIGVALVGWKDALRSQRRGLRLLGATAMIGMVVYLGDSVVGRSYDAIHRTPKAMKNIYDQQYQMGLFLRAHRQGQGIYANDIGAISFLADIHLVDIIGLATIEVARAHLQGREDDERMALLSQSEFGGVAVVYHKLFGHLFDALGWIEVSRWTMREKVVSDTTVTWYARDEANARSLLAQLVAFVPRLPPDVVATALWPPRSASAANP